MIYYNFEPRKKEWTVDSARKLLQSFDEYPDAVLEIIDGADQDAIAFKLGLLQL
tara:strand:- start:270 stop:431 length:162 start_codon:yes stop_codon:yes gene_type:complete